MSVKKGVEKAASLLKDMPRVGINNIKALPGTRKKHLRPRGRHFGKHAGRAHGGAKQKGTLTPLGYEGGQFPYILSMPREPYYKDYHTRRQYPPLSLHELQRLVDLGRIDTSQPIDMTSLCNTKLYKINVDAMQYGFNLTDDGADIFDAKVNIEVQWTNEVAIAAIEKNGGTITSKFYDKVCVDAMQNPIYFFTKGQPIPKCKHPPKDALAFYSSAKNRGYLANPDEIQEARYELAQKYGYELRDLTEDPDYEMLSMRKDPRQIWHGLAPGWVINVAERTIYKPTSEELKEYYRS